MRKSILGFVFFLLWFSQSCIADVQVNMEIAHFADREKEWKILDPALETQYIHDVCCIGNIIYVLATEAQTVAEDGLYTLYRIDESGSMVEIENSTSCMAVGTDEKLYFARNNDIYYVDRIEKQPSIYCTDVPRNILAMMYIDGVLLVTSEDNIWMVSRGFWRKIASTNGNEIVDIQSLNEEIVCKLADGSYVKVAFVADRTESFVIDAPEMWRDERLRGAIDAFEVMYPEYKVELIENTEDADIRIIDAADFDSTIHRSITGVPNMYYAKQTGTDVLFSNQQPLKSLFAAEERAQAEGVLEEYNMLPVNVSIWMLEKQKELPEECEPLPENCTYSELYMWAENVKEKTGIAGFADDADLPVAIRAFFSSFGLGNWNEDYIFQSEEFAKLLDMVKRGYESGSVISGEGDAFYVMRLVSGYTDLHKMRLLPQLEARRVYPSECTVIGRGLATEDSLRNGARSDFLYIYMNMQDRISWDDPGAGILKDISMYCGGIEDQITCRDEMLLEEAFLYAKLPNWRRYPQETIPYERYILDVLNDYFDTETTLPSAIRNLSGYVETVTSIQQMSVR